MHKILAEKSEKLVLEVAYIQLGIECIRSPGPLYKNMYRCPGRLANKARSQGIGGILL